MLERPDYTLPVVCLFNINSLPYAERNVIKDLMQGILQSKDTTKPA